MHSEIILDKGYKQINPVQFGYQSCPPSHGYGPATRPFWLFHFVVSGKGRFFIGEREYALTGGMMFVIPPFVETYYEADAADPWEYTWVGFTGTPPLSLADVYDIPDALRIFRHMRASHDLHQGRTEFILGKLWELFSLLIEGVNAPLDPVETALSIIRSEYMTALTVQQIADRIHLERTYFSDLFRRRVGMSPKQYLFDYRMQQAQHLLVSGYSVTVTATSVGYRDVYTFSKMFRRRFGYPPSAEAAHAHEKQGPLV